MPKDDFVEQFSEKYDEAERNTVTMKAVLLTEDELRAIQYWFLLATTDECFTPHDADDSTLKKIQNALYSRLGGKMTDYKSKLVVLDKENENATVYIIWDINEQTNEVFLVELDRPNDGFTKWVNIENIHVLKPIEVAERVTEWK